MDFSNFNTWPPQPQQQPQPQPQPQPQQPNPQQTANQQRWPNPFGGMAGQLGQAYNEADYWHDPDIPGWWLAQGTMLDALPGWGYAAGQGYPNMLELLGQGGSLDPGALNMGMASTARQGMMDRQALEAQMAQSGMTGSQMGQAQLGAIDQGQQQAQAGQFGGYLASMEDQWRNDLGLGYGMTMQPALSYLDPVSRYRSGQTALALAQGDRDLQELAGWANLAGNLYGADWSSLGGGGGQQQPQQPPGGGTDTNPTGTGDWPTWGRWI